MACYALEMTLYFAHITDATAETNRFLLRSRHIFRRNLDPEIAARDHHGVHERDDIFDACERRRLLDLCHDASAFFDEALRLNDAHRTLNKTTGQSNRRRETART